MNNLSSDCKIHWSSSCSESYLVFDLYVWTCINRPSLVSKRLPTSTGCSWWSFKVSSSLGSLIVLHNRYKKKSLAVFLLVDAVHLKTDTKLYSRDCCSRLQLFIFMQHEEKEVIHYERRKPGSFSSVQLAFKTFLCRWLQYFWKTSRRNDSGLPLLNSLPLGQNIVWSTSQLFVASDSGTTTKKNTSIMSSLLEIVQVIQEHCRF